ncbi:MAG: hypothetical protein H3C62_13100, partial [Gemmatimonadaceae bacterium]|nr:hypothetical protein [Gemmatimonadaceae bacterium]
MPLRPVVTPEGPRELSHAARATLLTQFETLRAAGLAAGLPELAAETARWRAQLLGCRSVGAVAAYDFAAEVARCCRAVFVAREAVWQTASSAPSSTDRAVVDALHARLFHPPHYPVDTGRSRRSDEHSCLFPDTFVALDHALHAM